MAHKGRPKSKLKASRERVQAARDSARARGEDAKAPPKEERIRTIMGLMLAPPGQPTWKTVTAFELAERWHLDPTTIRTDAAEASRRIRESAGSREEIRDRLVHRLDRLAELGEAQGDVKGATSALMGAAKLLGVEAPQKVAVTDAAGDDLPPQLRELARVGDMAALTRFFATGELPPKSSG